MPPSINIIPPPMTEELPKRSPSEWLSDVGRTREQQIEMNWKRYKLLSEKFGDLERSLGVTEDRYPYRNQMLELVHRAYDYLKKGDPNDVRLPDEK